MAPESAFQSKLASIWSGEDDIWLEQAFPADSTTLDASSSLISMLVVGVFTVRSLRAYEFAETSLRQSDDVLPFKSQISHSAMYWLNL